jgi:hypothetical protein
LAKITYYDFSHVDYGSFFVEGFLQLQNEGGHNFRVSKNIPDEIADLEITRWITYRKPPTTFVFRYEDPLSNFLFCVDANDHNGQDPHLADIYPGYHFPLIERIKFYFKINYHEETVLANPRLSSLAHKIIPLPLVYPVRPSQTRSLMPSITPLGKQRWPISVARHRLGRLHKLMPLQEYRQLREVPRDLDVFFMISLYMSKSHEEINARRLALLEAISGYTNLKTVIGFVTNDELPAPFARFQLQPMPFDEYMATLARSRIGLYTRGTFGALSFKFGQYFALGKPIVGEPLLNNRQNMYGYDHFSEQFNYSEPEAIAAKIAELAADPHRLQELKAANTATFEEHFTPLAVVRQLMRHISQKQGTPDPSIKSQHTMAH